MRYRLTFLFALLAAAGCGKGTSEKPPAKQTLADKYGGRLAAAPDLAMTAEDLGEEVNKNDKAAREKYRGKVIEVTGVVSGMNKDIGGTPVITLKGKGESYSLFLRTTEPRPWDKAGP